MSPVSTVCDRYNSLSNVLGIVLIRFALQLLRGNEDHQASSCGLLWISLPVGMVGSQTRIGFPQTTRNHAGTSVVIFIQASPQRPAANRIEFVP